MIRIGELKKIFTPTRHENLRALLRCSAREFAGDDAFIIKTKKGKEFSYEHISFADFYKRANLLGTALMLRGMQGKRVAIIGKNREEWMESYFAVLGGLGICVPLDKGLPYEELKSSLTRSQADVLIFDTAHEDFVRRLKADETGEVNEFICMDELDGFPSIPQLRKEAGEAGAEALKKYESLPIDAKAVSIILFTSGTTSMAKAVMLSHYNIVENVYAAQLCEDIRHGDVNMAFLPYHHTFGCTGQLVMLAAGAATAFCDGLKYLQKNMVEYRVSVFFCVPLLIESIYKKIMLTVKKEGLEGKVKFGLKLSKLLMKFGIDARRKLFKQILRQLGGNLRLVISGASAIDPQAVEGFNQFGITAVQGYGMTEAAPMLAAEDSAERCPGSIGKAFPGIELAIDEPNADGIGELIARGPNIMSGYYENPEETEKMLAGGWLHTGDLAYVNEDGFVFICGRKKNVIVLKNGKNVYPEELEQLISSLPYVEENMVFGKPRHENGDEKDLALCAKIVYKPSYMKEVLGLSSADEIEAQIRRDIDQINEQLPSYKQIFRLAVTDQPMIKTTTGKVKRYEEEKNL